MTDGTRWKWRTFPEAQWVVVSKYPHNSDESASPFVFICTNPLELLVKFPMKGKHKISKQETPENDDLVLDFEHRT
ncbi:activating signal cointegrator 1 [Tachysurus ichikawai]